MWPRIVAESLRILDRPEAPARCTPRPASLAAVRATIDAAARPARREGPPPAILLPHQVDAWRRITAALDAWGGALLAEPVGTGKTWIALAAAAVDPGRTIAFVPAILLDQWCAAARRAGVRLELWSHERLSRGTLPKFDATLVIIDEAHRFRHSATRRVGTIAPWLVGRRTLLLTATPLVNRAADLVFLLQLILPEDALALDGIARLADLERCATPPAALRRVVIRGAAQQHFRDRRRLIRVAADSGEELRGRAAVAAVDSLALSSDERVRRLVASVLLDAAASSGAAFGAALRRYRALLLQARDAGGASRTMLRRFAGESLDQLVLWPMIEPDRGAEALPIDDIGRVDRVLESPGDDQRWIGALLDRCDGLRPTVLFARHRATAGALRRAIGDQAAWVEGSASGIGCHRVPRELVLSAFGPHRDEWQVRRRPPDWLVATDVAAEGLDLQRAGRVVHVDLPWTATRLAQREGRLLRLGQSSDLVEVIVRLPPGAIETALRPLARVGHKERLARRWLDPLDATDPADEVGDVPLVATLSDGGDDAALVVVTLSRGDRRGMVTAARSGSGDWTLEEAAAGEVMRRAGRAAAVVSGPRATSRVIDDALRAIRGLLDHDDPSPGDLVSRIHGLARRAARRRDGTTLARLDRLLRFVTTPGSHGTRLILASLRTATDGTLQRWEAPRVEPAEHVDLRVVAAILLDPRAAG